MYTEPRGGTFRFGAQVDFITASSRTRLGYVS